MNIFTIGRLCLKLAGRDAGRTCVIVDEIDAHSVLVDGNVRRRKVNVKHLDPLRDVLEIKQGASHEVIEKAFTQRGLPVWEKKSKEAKTRQRKQKKVKTKPASEAKPAGEKKGKESKVKKTPKPSTPSAAPPEGKTSFQGSKE